MTQQIINVDLLEVDSNSDLHDEPKVHALSIQINSIINELLRVNKENDLLRNQLQKLQNITK